MKVVKNVYNANIVQETWPYDTNSAPDPGDFLVYDAVNEIVVSASGGEALDEIVGICLGLENSTNGLNDTPVALVAPLIPGVYLEGVTTATTPKLGLAVEVDTSPEKVDAVGSGYPIGRIHKILDVTAKIVQIRIAASVAAPST